MPHEFESPTEDENQKKILDSLREFGVTLKDDTSHVKGAYVVQFPFEQGVTTVRIELNDYSGADLVITNMTTLPHEQKRKGLGSKAIQQLLLWAKKNNLTDIRAVQVQEPSEEFWTKNGFTKCKEPNPCNDYTYQSPDNEHKG